MTRALPFHRSAILVSIFALGLVACGGQVSSSDDAPPASSGAARLAAAWCAQETRCNVDFFTHRYGDIETCVRNLAPYEDQLLFVDPNVRLPPNYVDDCVAGLDAQAGDTCTVDRPLACATPPGVVAAGGMCLSGADCDATSSCVYRASFGEAPPSCGACEARVPFPCGRCTAEETCTATGCKPKGHVGAACTGGLDCEDGMSCTGSVCTVLLKAGEHCDPISDSTGSCEKELACGLITSTCRPRLYAGVGEACGSVGDDFVECDRSACIIPSGSFVGTCLAFVRDGEACDPSGAPCEGIGLCKGGACSNARVCW